MAPWDAKPNDMFWVQEANGESNLRKYAMIQGKFKGKWHRDPIHGNMYFRKDNN